MKRKQLFNHTLYLALRTVESEYLNLLYNENSETVHDLRVSIRRLIPLLKLYKNGLTDIKTIQDIVNIINTYMRCFKSLSQLRDQQVMLMHLIKMHPSSLLVIKTLENDIKSKHNILLNEAFSWPIRELVDKTVLNMLQRPVVGQKLKKCTRNLIKKRKKTVEQLLSRPINGSKDLHKIRISIKKYRYVLEAAEALNIKTPISSSLLKTYQDELGMFQDISVLKDYLERIIPDSSFLLEVEGVYHVKIQSLISNSKVWKNQICQNSSSF